MAEPVQLKVARARLRLKAGQDTGAPTAASATGGRGPSAWHSGRQQIFAADTAGSRRLRAQTQMVLATLSAREQRVLRMHFGIGEHAQRTLDEIGRLFVLPRASVREIELQALRKLRRLEGANRSRSTPRV